MSSLIQFPICQEGRAWLIIFISMKNFVRKLVAGPKHKTPYQGQDLDLTYITDRLIAMAFPASNFFEKTFRNSIEDVAGYLQQYHQGNYLVLNVSSRSYDYGLFENRVLQYPWNDHQSPPLTSLFDMANKVHAYLTSKPKGVVAVHCNHGKGRTGTAIICMLLYLGYHQTAEQALTFYNSRRFSSSNYGVNQPCQIRYIQFFEKVLVFKQLPPKLVAYRLSSVSQEGLHDKHYISITHVRSGKLLVDRFNFGFHSKLGGAPLIGDLFIEVFEDGWPSSKNIARINFNSFFFHSGGYSLDTLSKDPIEVVFQGSSIKCSKSLPSKNFSISIFLEYHCLCHLDDSLELECECHNCRVVEEHSWRQMARQVREAHDFWKLQRSYFPKKLKEVTEEMKSEKKEGKMTNKVEDDIKEEQKKEEETHQIYPLSSSMSNIGNSNKVIGRIIEGPYCRLDESPTLKQKLEQQEEASQQRRTKEFDLKDFQKFKEG